MTQTKPHPQGEPGHLSNKPELQILSEGGLASNPDAKSKQPHPALHQNIWSANSNQQRVSSKCAREPVSRVKDPGNETGTQTIVIEVS